MGAFMTITRLLNEKTIFIDGAMGSMIQSLGLPAKEHPELYNISDPDAITGIHSQYLGAGADVVTANTLGAYDFTFGDELEGIVRAAFANAKTAVLKCGSKDKLTALDMGPTGRLIEPYGDFTFDEIYETYKKTAVLGESCGADLAIIETMGDIYEMKIAALAVKENTGLPFLCSVSVNVNGRTMMGNDLTAFLAAAEGLGAAALGINCVASLEDCKRFVKVLLGYASLPVLVQPNAGLPEMAGSRAVYKMEPGEFAEAMAQMRRDGAQLLGGCCGTTPGHISAMVGMCENIPAKPTVKNNFTIASNSRKAFIFGDKPVTVGERINPANNRALTEAIKSGDFDYLEELAAEQIDDGADIIDVNVFVPGTDEKENMESAVEALINCPVPLQFDSASPEVLEAAVRRYNGKAVINSVNGSAESMAEILPLAKRYGALVVGMTLDEGGIPEKAEGRLEIAERIARAAAEYGIDMKELFIDPICLPMANDPEAWDETVRAAGLIKEKLGVKVMIGLSNVSFGLADRETANKKYFKEALAAGIDAVICNPAYTNLCNSNR